MGDLEEIMADPPVHQEWPWFDDLADDVCLDAVNLKTNPHKLSNEDWRLHDARRLFKNNINCKVINEQITVDGVYDLDKLVELAFVAGWHAHRDHRRAILPSNMLEMLVKLQWDAKQETAPFQECLECKTEVSLNNKTCLQCDGDNLVMIAPGVNERY